MSDGLLKADKDWSKEADKVIPEAESLANKDLQKAIDNLLALEKKARQSSDLASTSRTLTSIVTICKGQSDWSMLNEQVLLLSKKHGQLKQAVTKMVQVVMDFLDDTPDLDTKLSVIETLRTVTEGKVSNVYLSFWALLICLDLCRSRARPRHANSIQYQEGARRYREGPRYPVRASGRDFWIHDPPREDRVHS